MTWFDYNGYGDQIRVWKMLHEDWTALIGGGLEPQG